MSFDHIFNNFERNLIVIDYCRQNRHTSALLILVYSSIDAMASLTVELDREVQRQDFIDWINNYFINEIPAHNIDAISLYAARCSVLHSLGSISRLSKDGRALEVGYYWESGDLKELPGTLNRVLEGELILIEINDLVEAFKKSIENFKSAILQNQQLSTTVQNRGLNVFYGHGL
ncbi:hypothetical protein [Paenibacillus sp. FSL E2-0178]|uniref:hypothetical protein n=1 Tax=Paenibacillus sp. FSL E2-0178 TaxID=2921361 RepID=UPI0031589FB5